MSTDYFQRNSFDNSSIEVIYFCPHTLRENLDFVYLDKERYVFEYNFITRFVFDEKELLVSCKYCIDRLFIFRISYGQSRFKKCFIKFFLRDEEKLNYFLRSNRTLKLVEK